jgi:leader peptidase (prepilin peptidase)/N-methyltransferase
MLAQILETLTSPRTQDSLLTHLLWWTAIIWFAALGGCVGSFLNVVWDRWGSDRGIVFPRSRCSECGQLIRWYHNLPVIGWLMLRGRCYDCGARIPAKHPFVEAVFAMIAVLLGMWLMSSWF